MSVQVSRLPRGFRFYHVPILLTIMSSNTIVVNSIMSKGTSHKSLMETITLLYMLNQIPESPKDNQQPQALSILSTLYQLPFQREKEIVDSLAFLAATTNDSTRVMAVCLEEARDRSSCTIRLASNTGDLDEVVHGFKLIARILERAASTGMICHIQLDIAMIN